MKYNQSHFSRRRFLAATAAVGLTPWLGYNAGAASSPLLRTIPSTGETIPAIGMGTWITFNVGKKEALRYDRLEVLKTFFALGGGMVDSSPMYGTAQDVMGWCLDRIEPQQRVGLMSATKIWSPAGGSGAQQVGDAERLWRLPRIDVMQIHNLVDWQDHLAMLLDMKAAGRVRYIGITTSHGSRHQQIEQIMASQPIDFVQFTYNMADRSPEQRLLPLAADRGIAVIVNRPFRRGGLIDATDGKPLPGWAADIGVTTWAQALLKFIISHPAVTCAIPATSQVAHMKENMATMTGPLPDATLRSRMADDFAAP